MEHFGAVFKQYLTEETRTQLQEEEATASSCLILATPMISTLFVGSHRVSVCIEIPLKQQARFLHH